MPRKEVEEDDSIDFEDGDIVWVQYGNVSHKNGYIHGTHLAAVVFDVDEVPSEFRSTLKNQIKKVARGHAENYVIVKFYSSDSFTTTHKNKIRPFGEGGKIRDADKKFGKDDPKGFKLALKDFNEGMANNSEKDKEVNNNEEEEVEEKRSKKKKRDEEDEEDEEDESRTKKKKKKEESEDEEEIEEVVDKKKKKKKQKNESDEEEEE